ncbi:MAG: HAMP domain-containing histidine kinase, partial [Candidatus Omnitrophica bacterium]|nr:HAMP domain-containing histidine kinase [Candidatus Omnitrophota bacterium]
QRETLFVDEINLPKLSTEIIAIPFFVTDRLESFLILGPKPKNARYLDTDLTTFDILSSQISLALENCIYWQQEKERLAREEQIRRLQAMDHFSSSMAHEIDNPIMAITGQLHLIELILKERFKDKIPQKDLEELLNHSQKTVQNLQRISKLIKAVREFSKQDKGELTIINLDEAVEFALTILEPQLKYKQINFKKDIEKNLKVKGNKIYLAEVLMNLINNSIDAVSSISPWQATIELKIYRNTKKTCIIEVADNGCGIEKELLEDIFLDFVTTKASTSGTGMGLARVRKIVQLHQGKVWAESKGQNQGARFFVELPLVD